MGKTRSNRGMRGGKRGKSHKKNTRKRGGGILGSIVGLRNIKYINILEKRLVNKCNDYDWVQEQRVGSMRMKRSRKDYE
jgi:hypothetical protein